MCVLYVLLHTVMLHTFMLPTGMLHTAIYGVTQVYCTLFCVTHWPMCCYTLVSCQHTNVGNNGLSCKQGPNISNTLHYLRYGVGMCNV